MSLEIGELVRCKDEQGNWVGEIVGIDKHNLTVKWFADDKHYKVPSQAAMPFARFLANQKRSRKLKIVYSEFYGGKPLKRMPAKRLTQLQKVLRDHGIAFDETVTAADQAIRMWVNQAHLTQQERKQLQQQDAVLPENITTWLPKWLVTDSLPPSSRDPLGLQADAGQLANALLPGLTVFTNRVGYFFFLSWMVRELNQLDGLTAKERRDMLNRTECALVLCETLYHGKNDLKSCFHQGQRTKQRLLAEATTTATIPDRILKNQNSTGCYNLYRTAMRSCGFWEDHDESGLVEKLPFILTARGEKLATAFARRKGTKQLLKWAKNGNDRRNIQTLQQWGAAFCFHGFDKKTDKRLFLDGFLFAQDDRADVVNDADTRLQTLHSLANAGLLTDSTSTSPNTTLISSEEAGADVTELENAPDWGENATFLLHFYRDRTLSGNKSFVAAAVYELLGLALNAVWSGLIDSVLKDGRISLSNWRNTLIQESATPQFWEAPWTTAASSIRVAEEQLVQRLFTREEKVERGLKIAATVLNREDNRAILDEHLAHTSLYTIVKTELLSNPNALVRNLLMELIDHLIRHHRTVSERKGRERWIDTDGSEVWDVEARPMSLGFHSYRFPQLKSLVRDLHLTEHDLNES